MASFGEVVVLQPGDVVPVPVQLSEDVDGKALLLTVPNSVTAANSRRASFLYDVLRLLRCSAGTARNTISMMSPAMARTIKTSMMVKPVLRPLTTTGFGLLPETIGLVCGVVS